MKKILSNVWTKRLLSIVSVLYTASVCRLAYLSIFYEIHIVSAFSLCMLVTGISLFSLVIMLYSRKQILTRISSFIILPAMVPVAILYLGNWGLIIPIMVTGAVILLFSSAGEGWKTAGGTITLLLYLFSALGYFLFTSFFMSSAKQTVVDSGVSPSGKYRYEVINTEDTSKGSTTVYVEPNYADVSFTSEEHPIAVFTLKNIRRAVYVSRPIEDKINIEWSTQSREEITDELEKLSDNIKVSLSEENLTELGYTYDQKLMLSVSDLDSDDKFAIGLTAHDVDPIPLDDLSDDKLAHFSIARENSGRYYITVLPDELLEDFEDHEGRVYLSDLTSRQLSKLYVEKNRSVPLSTLSDNQLEKLGVSSEGDVLTFNGKVCFRFYIAEIENYYDVNSRKLSFDLLS